MAAVRSVAATTDYGTERANGVGLLEQALNLKSPTIYDVVEMTARKNVSSTRRKHWPRVTNNSASKSAFVPGSSPILTARTARAAVQ